MSRGRVYRRCACRDEHGRQLGKRCPLLADNRKHGRWYYALDVPRADNRRRSSNAAGSPRKPLLRKRWTMLRPGTALVWLWMTGRPWPPT